jgi:amino acid adenylation domain-containing protein
MLSVSLIAQSIATQAATRPDALAVIGTDGALTYRTLDRRANALAHRLRALGVGPDVVVAVIAPRSGTMVVAALAVLKAGGAYLPIDPAYPSDRVAFILDDGEPAAVLHAPGLVAGLVARECPAIAVDVGAGDEADAPPPVADATLAHPAHLAYLIYTSGSTGRPKGVECTRRGLDNLVRWHLRTFDVGHDDRAMLYASPGFDAAVWEIWPALAAGASLHLPDDETRLSPERLRDWLVAEGITIGFVPRPMAERLIAIDWPASTALRTLLTGADTLHRYPPPTLPFALVNNYGPTECAVVATSGIVPPDPLADGLPSIGWPISNVTVHVLDAHGWLVSRGGEGELYVGGAGVARGYRHLPELTAERFVDDPFGPEGSRLYRTGDRVRVLSDGSLTFLGRVDDQVKIRGHRVELDEIVAVLDTHPGVEASAVGAHSGADGETRLAAYVVAAPGAVLTPSTLRATLQECLPDYMLPSTFVPLDALPLTASGKLDRARLPAPETVETLRDSEVVAPRTAVEARLAAMVAGLLDVPSIGVTDNFFLLGGHSLLGTQLIVRMRDAFGVDLPLRTVFDHPTIEALADEVERMLLIRLEAA